MPKCLNLLGQASRPSSKIRNNHYYTGIKLSSTKSNHNKRKDSRIIQSPGCTKSLGLVDFSVWRGEATGFEGTGKCSNSRSNNHPLPLGVQTIPKTCPSENCVNHCKPCKTDTLETPKRTPKWTKLWESEGEAEISRFPARDQVRNCLKNKYNWLTSFSWIYKKTSKEVFKLNSRLLPFKWEETNSTSRILKHKLRINNSIN